MRSKDIQRELCIRPGTTPEETLKSALLQEEGAQTATDLQKQFGSSASMGSFSQSGSSSAQNTRINRNLHFLSKGRNCQIESFGLRIISRREPKRKRNYVISVVTGFQQIINKAVQLEM